MAHPLYLWGFVRELTLKTFLLSLALLVWPFDRSMALEIQLPNCGREFEGLLINGAIPSERYMQLSDNLLKEADAEFLHMLEPDLQKLKPGAVIFDSGGGYSLYGIELALRGFKVITVNSQDFYGDLVIPLAGKLQRSLDSSGDLALFKFGNYGGVLKVGGMYASVLKNMGTALKVPFPELPEISKGSSENLRRLFLSKLLTFVKAAVARLDAPDLKANFLRKTGWVHEVLQQTPSNSVDALIDLRGGFRYWPDRLFLLDNFYRVLKPGARAEISLEDIWDNIAATPLVSGDPGFYRNLEKLFDTLYPRHSLIRYVDDPYAEKHVLLLTKSADVPDLKLQERFTIIEQKMRSLLGDGHTVPVLKIRQN